jgi:hypothetical protein
MEDEMPAREDLFQTWFWKEFPHGDTGFDLLQRGYVAGYHAHEVAAQQVAEATPADGAFVTKIREIVEMLEPMKPQGLAREILERLRQLLADGAA